MPAPGEEETPYSFDDASTGGEDFHDFDADLAQSGVGVVAFRIVGRDYTAPKDPPAEAILRIMRKGLSLDNPEDIADLLTSLIGKENLDSMFDGGVRIIQLMRLGKWLVDKYGFSIQEVVDEEIPNHPPTPVTSIGTGVI